MEEICGGADTVFDVLLNEATPISSLRQGETACTPLQKYALSDLYLFRGKKSTDRAATTYSHLSRPHYIACYSLSYCVVMVMVVTCLAQWQQGGSCLVCQIQEVEPAILMI